MLVEERAFCADLTPTQLWIDVLHRSMIRVNDPGTDNVGYPVDMLYIIWDAGLSRTPKGQLALTDHSPLPKNQQTS